mgnify:CR=1 FL=1
MKHRFWGGAGSRVFPACRYPHILCLVANEKDVSLSLEMTKARSRYSPSFPWKENTEGAEVGIERDESHGRRSVFPSHPFPSML